MYLETEEIAIKRGLSGLIGSASKLGNKAAVCSVSQGIGHIRYTRVA